MTEAQEIIRNRLFELADADYAEFQRKLMPTVAPERVIGVRTPALRAFAKEFFNVTILDAESTCLAILRISHFLSSNCILKVFLRNSIKRGF